MPPKKDQSQWMLCDGDRELYVGSEIAGLMQAITEIPTSATQPNTICNLISPSGNILSIGIAKKGTQDNPKLLHDLACVNYQAASGEPPYLCVLGNCALVDTDGVVVFRYGGTWTELLRRNCVSIPTMHSIASHFRQHDALPCWIDWEIL